MANFDKPADMLGASSHPPPETVLNRDVQEFIKEATDPINILSAGSRSLSELGKLGRMLAVGVGISRGVFRYFSKRSPIEVSQPDKPELTQISKVAVKTQKQPHLPQVTVHFDLDKAELCLEDKSKLDQIALAVKKMTEPTFSISIEGHTCDLGSNSHNQNLSLRRALAVVDYLKQKGIDPMRLTTKGYGEQRPIAANTSNQNRAMNRRVEIQIKIS